MKSIGFVDYYLDEWHANKYPSMIEEYNLKNGTSFKLTHAYGDIDSPNGITNEEWCRKMGVKKCESIEEICALCDYVIILSPSDPDRHLEQAKRVFRCGKSPYIDKTFADNYENASEIYRMADECGVRFFTTSALRYANELDGYAGKSREMSTFGGGRSIEEYIIHQIEMVVRCVGVGAVAVRYGASDNLGKVEILYPDSRSATMTYAPELSFEAVITGEDGESHRMEISSPYFDNLIGEILKFFTTGRVPFAREETLEIMKIRDGVLRAVGAPGERICL